MLHASQLLRPSRDIIYDFLHDHSVRDRLQISLLLLSAFKCTNFNSPWNQQKSYGFLMISGGIEVDWFGWIGLMSGVKFGDNSFVLIIFWLWTVIICLLRLKQCP